MAKIYLNKDGVLFTRTKNHDGRFVTLHFSQDIIPFIIRNNIQLYQELPNKWKENSSTLDYIFTLNNGEDKKTACIFTTKCPILHNNRSAALHSELPLPYPDISLQSDRPAPVHPPRTPPRRSRSR